MALGGCTDSIRLILIRLILSDCVFQAASLRLPLVSLAAIRALAATVSLAAIRALAASFRLLL